MVRLSKSRENPSLKKKNEKPFVPIKIWSASYDYMSYDVKLDVTIVIPSLNIINRRVITCAGCWYFLLFILKINQNLIYICWKKKINKVDIKYHNLIFSNDLDISMILDNTVVFWINFSSTSVSRNHYFIGFSVFINFYLCTICYFSKCIHRKYILL